MTTRTGNQKLARAVQRVVEDETGHRARYTTCLRLVGDYLREPSNRLGKTKEEKAADVFIRHREQLLATAHEEPATLGDALAVRTTPTSATEGGSNE